MDYEEAVDLLKDSDHRRIGFYHYEELSLKRKKKGSYWQRLPGRFMRWVGLDSYVLSTVIHKRTSEENKRWRHKKGRTLPSYFTLARLEFEAMYQEASRVIQAPWARYPLILACLIAVIIGLGHLLTDRGRRTLQLTARKYFMFTLVAFGYWSDDMVEAFGIHENIKKMSIAFDKPLKYVSKRPKYKGVTEKESKELFMLRQEELKRHLRQDYSMILFAQVCTRAILFQIVPILTVLTIFTSITSPTPMLVYSERLRKNLPELFVWDAFDRASVMEQQRIDEANCIRKYELRVKNNGRTVNEWLVFLIGVTTFCTESRAINFALNVYKFIMTLVILLMSNSTNWMIAAVLILLPFCFVRSLTFIIILGKAMDITDDDLLDAITCGLRPPKKLKVLDKPKYMTDAEAIERNGAFRAAQSGGRYLKSVELPPGPLGIELEPAFVRDHRSYGMYVRGWTRDVSDIMIRYPHFDHKPVNTRDRAKALLKPGTVIVSVNDINVERMDFHDAVDVLINTATSRVVTFMKDPADDLIDTKEQPYAVRYQCRVLTEGGLPIRVSPRIDAECTGEVLVFGATIDVSSVIHTHNNAYKFLQLSNHTGYVLAANEADEVPKHYVDIRGLPGMAEELRYDKSHSALDQGDNHFDSESDSDDDSKATEVSDDGSVETEPSAFDLMVEDRDTDSQYSRFDDSVESSYHSTSTVSSSGQYVWNKDQEEKVHRNIASMEFGQPYLGESVHSEDSGSVNVSLIDVYETGGGRFSEVNPMKEGGADRFSSFHSPLSDQYDDSNDDGYRFEDEEEANENEDDEDDVMVDIARVDVAMNSWAGESEKAPQQQQQDEGQQEAESKSFFALMFGF
jgi:hypothetical protein